MAKLTKAQTCAHEKANALLALDHALTDDEVLFVLDHWHEGAGHANTRASAHFTPYQLAEHAALEVYGFKVLDMCAGIGILSVAVSNHFHNDPRLEITLVEINPDYAAVARRLLPNAEVIVGSMYDTGLMADLATRGFNTCISNPPFGSFSKSGEHAPRYRGGEAHYDCIDIASDIADHGVFILPQTAVPFRYSGRQSYEAVPRGQNTRYDRFVEQTQIELGANLGIDTSVLPGFRDVGIVTEISTVDFREVRALRADLEMPLFARRAA